MDNSHDRLTAPSAVPLQYFRSPCAVRVQSKCSQYFFARVSSLLLLIKYCSVVLLVCSAIQVSVSVRLFVPWHEERYKGPRDTTPGLCRLVILLACPTRHWHRWRLLWELLTIAEPFPKARRGAGCAKLYLMPAESGFNANRIARFLTT